MSSWWVGLTAEQFYVAAAARTFVDEKLKAFVEAMERSTFKFGNGAITIGEKFDLATGVTDDDD